MELYSYTCIICSYIILCIGYHLILLYVLMDSGAAPRAGARRRLLPTVRRSQSSAKCTTNKHKGYKQTQRTQGTQRVQRTQTAHNTAHNTPCQQTSEKTARAWMRAYARARAHACVLAYTLTHICIYIYIYIYTYVCMYVRTYVRMCVYIICIYIYIYICICICVSGSFSYCRDSPGSRSSCWPALSFLPIALRINTPYSSSHRDS